MDNEKTTKKEAPVEKQEQNKTVNKTAKTVGNDYQIPTENTDNPNLFSGVSVIGIGQGGTNLALLLEKSLRKVSTYSKLLVINTALSDLSVVNIPKERKFLLGMGEGMGKRREEGKKSFWGEDGKSDELFNKFVSENNQLFFGSNQLVIVCYSSGGGSGSGIGNKFLMKLTKYCATVDEKYITVKDGKKVSVPIDPYRPNVIGLCLTPDIDSVIDSGEDALNNTMQCMTEIDTLVKNKAASIFIVRNSLPKNLQDGENIYDKTNRNVVDAFTKFIKTIGTSDTNTILDVRDRFAALSYPGLMSFTSIDNPNQYNMLQPAIGSHISGIVAELSYTKETYQKKVEKYNRFASNYIVSDQTIGWNDLDKIPENERTELKSSDIILFTGFSGLDSILEPIKAALDRKIKARENDNIQGRAFEELDVIQKQRMAERTKNLDVDDLI